MVIRMNTDYSEEKSHGRAPKANYQRFRGQNRILNKVSRDKR